MSHRPCVKVHYDAVMRRLDYYWYHKHPLVMLLVPLSWLFCMVSMLRRKAYQAHLLKVTRLPVPVIIVGNISVGGTGKTPLVVWLVDFLKQAGYKPAIISRGYGGGAQQWPQRVTPDSDAASVGDEAVLLARRCVCPMAVAPNRVAAAQMVLENNGCDIIVCDDGLQHYALARDIEIAVIDGVRRFGNGYCLPAGPLREPPGRLGSVDFVVVNGEAVGTGEVGEITSAARGRKPKAACPAVAHVRPCDAHGCASVTGGRTPGETARDTWASAVQGCTSAARGRKPEVACPAQFSMRLHPGALRQVNGDNKICDPDVFHGQVVHAVAGIGNPARFFRHLKKSGINIIEHAFPDHHPFAAQDLQFGDDASVIMTEKDAVKCRGFARENHWYMPVDAQLDSEFGERLLRLLSSPLSLKAQ